MKVNFKPKFPINKIHLKKPSVIASHIYKRTMSLSWTKSSQWVSIGICCMCPLGVIGQHPFMLMLWLTILSLKTYLDHYSDVMISAMASQITSLSIVYWIVSLGTDQRKHQSSISLAFVRGIHQWPVNSPHKGPVMWKMYPFGDVIICPQEDESCGYCLCSCS